MHKSNINSGKAVTDMTTGNPIKRILVFMVPLLIGNLFQQVYSIVDTMIAGHVLGEQAIAAIGATSSIYGLLVNFAFGLNSGYGIVIAKTFGSRDTGKLKTTIGMAMLMNIAIGFLLTAFGLLFMQQLMLLMNVPEGILQDTVSYISIIIGGMLTTIGYNLFAGIMRALGNSRAPLYFLMISSVENCILDVVFVAVLRLGIAGAALATVLAQATSAVLSGFYLWKQYKEYLPKRENIIFQADIFRDLFSTGIAMAAMLTVVDFGSVAYQRAINALGDLFITAHTSARRLIGIFMMPLGSIATANSTFVAQNWGAKQIRRIKSTLKSVIALEVAWAVFALSVVLLFGEKIVILLTGSENKQMLGLAMLSLRWHFLCYPALGILLALRTTLQALGQKIIPIVSSGVELTVKILFGIWVIPAMGYLAVCIAEPIIWVACMIFLFIYCYRRKLFSKDEEIKL